MENKEINDNMILTECDFAQNERRVLSERDFYPPIDNRLHDLGIEDILGGDTYDEYLKEFWELYEDELYC